MDTVLFYGLWSRTISGTKNNLGDNAKREEAGEKDTGFLSILPVYRMDNGNPVV